MHSKKFPANTRRYQTIKSIVAFIVYLLFVNITI